LVFDQVGPEAFFRPHPHVPDVELPLPFHVADDPAYDARSQATRSAGSGAS
jgi:hypothetical protein